MWPETLAQADEDRAQEARYWVEMRRADDAVEALVAAALAERDEDEGQEGEAYEPW